MGKRAFFHAFFGLIACAALGCGNGAGSTSSAGGGGSGGSGNGGTGGGGAGQPSAQALYGADIKKIVLEVDYAAGAEPYTGSIIGFGDTWDLFETNAGRLFEGGNKTLVVPHTLAEMEKLPDVSGDDFTSTDIFAIADKHRTQKNTADTAVFYVVWLPGYYDDEAGRNENTLGVSFGKTGVIAMFKPVIDSSGGADPVLPRFVEQMTLIHEFGHGAGLVNNGIAMASEHQDTAHGAHCANQDCIMFWQVEGASDIVGYAQDAIAKGDTDLFGQECLDDAHAALQK